MATVVSLTEAKIKELLSGYEGVALSQDEINALIIQLSTDQDTVNARMTDLNENVLPTLESDLAANANQVSNLNDTVIPNVQVELDQNSAALLDMNTVTLPAMRSDLDSGIANALILPRTFFADEPPTGLDPLDPDDPESDNRDLQIDDVWYDTNDGYTRYRWSGTEWVTFSVDVADLSLTVRKFQTTTHVIYSEVYASDPLVTKGANIT